jgi:hypothetical protein
MHIKNIRLGKLKVQGMETEKKVCKPLERNDSTTVLVSDY